MLIVHREIECRIVRYKKRQIPVCSQQWTQQQDIYLIENNQLPLEQLQQHLSYSADEITARRKILGLTTRSRQLKKLGL